MTRLLEIQSGVALTICGAVLLNPLTQTFAAIPAYAGLAYIAPEWAWGIGLLTLGTAQLAASRYKNFGARAILAFASACTWLAISAALSVYPTPRISLAMGVFPSFFLAQAFAYLTLKSEARQVWRS